MVRLLLPVRSDAAISTVPTNVHHVSKGFRIRLAVARATEEAAHTVCHGLGGVVEIKGEQLRRRQTARELAVREGC